mmetsp:Transcript_94147/g.167458  ORF Transcript_94147/g.167458 Transcript_94147/m.167458 type:complete len:539 (-) Transcript_94147:209-1825(-)
MREHEFAAEGRQKTCRDYCVRPVRCCVKCCPTPRSLVEEGLWQHYRYCCNCLLGLPLLLIFLASFSILLWQSVTPIQTPGIELKQLFPVVLPTASNWSLILFCQLEFKNKGDREVIFTEFGGKFEYLDFSDLGDFVLDPKKLPMVLKPGDVQISMARLKMNNHDAVTKARVGTGFVTEWIQGKNPVLKLRVEAAGSIWAWGQTTKFTAEYLCNYALHTASHGLGLFDFSDWEAAQKKWTEAINKGRDETGLAQLKRTKLGGDVGLIMNVLIVLANVSLFLCCCINSCATCYTCQYPEEHRAKGNDALSILNVIFFGASRRARQDWEAQVELELEQQKQTLKSVGRGKGLRGRMTALAPPAGHFNPQLPGHLGGSVPGYPGGPLGYDQGYPGGPPPGYAGSPLPGHLGGAMQAYPGGPPGYDQGYPGIPPPGYAQSPLPGHLGSATQSYPAGPPGYDRGYLGGPPQGYAQSPSPGRLPGDDPGPMPAQTQEYLPQPRPPEEPAQERWPAIQRSYSGLGRIRVSVKDSPQPYGRNVLASE